MIIGGKPVRPHSVPWQVGLIKIGLEQFNVKCGGTLISVKHVLSAAHCENQFPFEVLVGGHDIWDKDKSNVHSVAKNGVHVHPKYEEFLHGQNDEGAVIYDFMMITLRRPVTHINAMPARLPSRFFQLDEEFLIGKNLTVSGWGTTNP